MPIVPQIAHYQNRPLPPHLQRYWSHLGATLAPIDVIAFTRASLLIVNLGLNWRELATRRD